MDLDVPDQLIRSVPVVAGMLLLVGAVLAFAWRVVKQQQTVSDRQNALTDSMFTRHEAAEVRQFEVIDRLSDSVGELTTELRASRDERANGDPLRSLSHETRVMTHDQPEYHIGLPPGHEAPDEILARSRITGEVKPWTWTEFGIDALYEAGVRGRGATVVVIDTGIDPNHTDLKGNHAADKSKSWTGEPLNDGNGHGTHCAGIVAADDNGSGVQGVAPDATIVAMKGLSNQGSGYGNWLANAIRAAADLPGHKILSMSFGAGGEDPVISAAIRYAHGKGCWLVAAAGNDGPGSINWPGALDEVICVASTDKGGGVSSFSSANDFVDVGFGGRDILSTYPGNRLATMSGTSMATPGVAGVLALAVGEMVKAGVTQLPTQAVMTDVLYATCSSPAGRNVYTGYGLVQPAKFVKAMVARFAPGAPKPDPDPKPPVTRVAIPAGAKFIEFVTA